MGALAQPWASWSSLAYLGAGGWLWSRRRRAIDPAMAGAYALAVAANGIGGMAFHGRGDRVSRWVHDTALCATLAIAATSPTDPRSRHSPATAPLVIASAALVAVRPRHTNQVTAALTAAAAGRAARSHSLFATPAPLLVFGITTAGAAVANLVSRDGRSIGPLRWATGHSAWHLFTALALAAWGVAIAGSRSADPEGVYAGRAGRAA